MIRLLAGEIKVMKGDYLILLVGQVGYKVESMAPFRLGLVGNSVELYIYTHVRETELRLFGFASMDELEMFERLLSVSGIGPKSALLIMAEHSPARIVHAVKLADPTVLRVKGVGSKSLAKIVIELKGKLDDFVGLTEGGDATLDEQSGRFVHTGAGNQEDSELFSALENLGFSSEQIKQVIESVPKDETLGQQIKAALSLLRN